MDINYFKPLDSKSKHCLWTVFWGPEWILLINSYAWWWLWFGQVTTIRINKHWLEWWWLFVPRYSSSCTKPCQYWLESKRNANSNPTWNHTWFHNDDDGKWIFPSTFQFGPLFLLNIPFPFCAFPLVPNPTAVNKQASKQTSECLRACSLVRLGRLVQYMQESMFLFVCSLVGSGGP